MKTYNFDKNNFMNTRGFKIAFDKDNIFITNDLILFPLYKKIEIPEVSLEEILPYHTKDKEITLELYCPICKKTRIFTFEQPDMKYIMWENAPTTGGTVRPPVEIQKDIHKERFFRETEYFSLYALAECGHQLIIDFRIIDNDTVEKIGQFPSIYDVNENINNKYFLDLLDKEYRSYYTKACSLYSFNSCIGAMTYLRRIFEKLLLDTFLKNYDAKDLGEFKKKRMEDKVKDLKDYLPTLLQEQGFCEIYSLISDGVHNLTEEQCQKRFNILRMAIEEILKEEVKKTEDAKTKQKIQKELQNI